MYSRHIGLRICCKKAGAGAFLCHLDLCTVGLRFGHANLRLVLAGLCCKHPEGFWTAASLSQPGHPWSHGMFSHLHLPHTTMYYLYLSHINSCVLRYQHLLVLYGHPSALDALMLPQRCLNRACPICQGQTPSSIPSVKHLVLSTTLENLRHCRRFRWFHWFHPTTTREEKKSDKR